jgi:hypothetical protein
MTTTEITVGYERKFSDGNYGSEGVSLSATLKGDDGELTDELAIDCTSRLRAVVLALLASSVAPRVASAAQYELNPPPPRPKGRDFEPDESPF